MDEEKITLVNADGEEQEFIKDDEFEFEGSTYIVLAENEESEDAMLFRIEEDENGEIYLQEVEDDDEFERVSEFYFEDDDEE